jgi:hypothetical protein
MKPKPELDLEIPSRLRRWYWRIRSIGQLMIVIALSGLVLSVVPPILRGPVRGSLNIKNVRGRKAVIPGPIGRLPADIRPSRDPFVIIASAEIDPGMVVRADPDLDAEMVFNPETGRRGLSRSAPASTGGLVAPQAIPEPAPVAPPPRVWELRPPVVPQAQPR